MAILVAGVHGVGKTTLCSKLTECLNGNWTHFSAGNFIKKVSKEENYRNSGAEQILKNQNLIAQEIIRLELEGRKVLIDGHFVLRDSDDNLLPISVDIFSSLDLTGVILIDANADYVIKNLKNRDITYCENTSMGIFLRAERTHAHEVCRVLGLPLKVIFEPTFKQFSDAAEILSK